MSVNCNRCGLDFDGPHRMDTAGECVHPMVGGCIEALRLRVAELEAELARLRPVVNEAEEVIAPFMLMATAWADKPDEFVVAEVGVQSLRVSSFRDAREFFLRALGRALRADEGEK